jgi:hypothetical protein
MADDYGRGWHAPKRAVHVAGVTGNRIEAVLGSYCSVPGSLKRRDHLTETRPIGPEPVSEDHADFTLRGTHVSVPPEVKSI